MTTILLGSSVCNLYGCLINLLPPFYHASVTVEILQSAAKIKQRHGEASASFFRSPHN